MTSTYSATEAQPLSGGLLGAKAERVLLMQLKLKSDASCSHNSAFCSLNPTSITPCFRCCSLGRRGKSPGQRQCENSHPSLSCTAVFNIKDQREAKSRPLEQSRRREATRSASCRDGGSVQKLPVALDPASEGTRCASLPFRKMARLRCSLDTDACVTGSKNEPSRREESERSGAFGEAGKEREGERGP